MEKYGVTPLEKRANYQDDNVMDTLVKVGRSKLNGKRVNTKRPESVPENSVPGSVPGHGSSSPTGKY